MAEEAVYRVPTRLASAVFRCKAILLTLRRGAQDIKDGLRRCPHVEEADFPYCIAESRTSLWSEESLIERTLQQGKVQNLRCAVRRLNRTLIPSNTLFSFWKQVGRATRRRGYVPGRQLQEGCLFPAIGGGLCQLSNALYDLALQAECEIVERHPHSHIVPGSAAEQGRDATVAWNYLDLRFRSTQPLQIEARLTQDALIVRLRSRQPALPDRPSARSRRTISLPLIPVLDTRLRLDSTAHSCATCGQEACFRHRTPTVARQFLTEDPRDGARTAYLMDENWPEFQSYLTSNHTAADVLGIPLDGARWHQPRYHWDTTGYAHVGAATWPTLTRALAARRLGHYGAARLQAQLEGAEALARRLALELRADITHVCLAQSLLPFLWRDGHLGGRHFEVLMTRLPLHALHARLDVALAAHPERRTLGEFRAPEWMVSAEAEALAAADQIVTPHTSIAALFPGRTCLLDWKLPAARPIIPGTALAFPGPTAARKGAYLLRAVARRLDLEIVLLGSELEGDGFWDGVRTRRVPSVDWLNGIAAVVQPALVEDRPRPLLAALSSGVPVIATPACGLGAHPLLTLLPEEDEDALLAAICCLA